MLRGPVGGVEVAAPVAPVAPVVALGAVGWKGTNGTPLFGAGLDARATPGAVVQVAPIEGVVVAPSPGAVDEPVAD